MKLNEQILIQTMKNNPDKFLKVIKKLGDMQVELTKIRTELQELFEEAKFEGGIL